jgi:diacylglycerol kinase (ATP)
MTSTSSSISPSTSSRTIWILLSRTAGRGKASGYVQRLQQHLTQNHWSVRCTDQPQALQTAATTWIGEDVEASQRPRAVLAIGGDGTLRLAASLVPPAMPLLPVPLGTQNLVARWLGQSSEPSAIAQTLLRGQSRVIDAGRVNGSLFLMMVSVGFDADVVRRVDQSRRGPIRHWTYVPHTLAAARHYAFPKLRCTIDGTPSPAMRWWFIFNLPLYATGLKIVPNAIGDDRVLDACGLERGGWWSPLRYAMGVRFGARHLRWPDVRVHRGTTICIESDEPVAVQADGDYIGMTPATIHLEPARVTLLAPR